MLTHHLAKHASNNRSIPSRTKYVLTQVFIFLCQLTFQPTGALVTNPALFQTHKLKLTAKRDIHHHWRTSPYSQTDTTTIQQNHYRHHLSRSHLYSLPPTNNVIASAAASLATIQHTLHADPTFVLSAVLLLSTFGIQLEKKTVVGKALSAPLATMALGLVLANIGIVPFSSPIYNCVNRFLVPLAIPLLLYDSNLRVILTTTGPLLLAFFVGTIATILGTVVAYPLIPLGNDGWKIACALAARHIGGAINFVAVAETLNVEGASISAAIAADNVVVALYFAFLFYLSRPGETTIKSTGDSDDDITVDAPSEEGEGGFMDLTSLATSVTVASSLVTLGGILTRLFLPTGTSSLPITSLLTVFTATAFPSFFSRLKTSGSFIGTIFIQMFFAASGAAGNIFTVIRSARSLFFFSALQIAVHFVILVSLGKLVFGLGGKELYLASNACVGGPTTAAAMAKAKDWRSSIVPAFMIGILGYASATGIALAMGPLLLRLPMFGR